MRDLKKAYDLIKEFEGLYLKAYLDPVGIPTIGWGTIRYPDGSKVRVGDVITLTQAQDYLEHEVSGFVNSVEQLVKVSLNDNQLCALVSFCYNLGAGNFGSSTLLKKLNAGDYVGASAEFPRWNKAGGKVLAGLTRRRNAERALFDSTSGVFTPIDEKIPTWFEPFKKLIQSILEAVFGKTTLESGVIPESKDIEIEDNIFKLNPQINPLALKEALKWKDNSKITNKNHILIVDFNRNDSQLRAYLLNMKTQNCDLIFKIAHGKNSDPNKDGLATEFSDVSGSYKSSLGPVLIGREFKNPKWKRVRLLYGLLPGVNGNIQKERFYFTQQNTLTTS